MWNALSVDNHGIPIRLVVASLVTEDEQERAGYEPRWRYTHLSTHEDGYLGCGSGAPCVSMRLNTRNPISSGADIRHLAGAGN
jgi:hypothetical protein